MRWLPLWHISPALPLARLPCVLRSILGTSWVHGCVRGGAHGLADRGRENRIEVRRRGIGPILPKSGQTGAPSLANSGLISVEFGRIRAKFGRSHSGVGRFVFDLFSTPCLAASAEGLCATPRQARHSGARLRTACPPRARARFFENKACGRNHFDRAWAELSTGAKAWVFCRIDIRSRAGRTTGRGGTARPSLRNPDALPATRLRLEAAAQHADGDASGASAAPRGWRKV